LSTTETALKSEYRPAKYAGAGGLIAANYLYNIAAKDGTVLGPIIFSVIVNQIFKEENVLFDASKFQWIGNPLEAGSVTAVFYTAPVKSWQDAQIHTAIIGATGPNGPDAMVAKLANATLGTKFQIVSGYKGGQDIALAMERGEVHGRGTQSWTGWKATNPEWVADGKLIPLWQLATKPRPDLERVPLLIDLVSGEEDKALVKVYTDVNALGRPLAGGPDVPAARIALLRKAFDDTMSDAAFVADAEKLQVELGPVGGEEIQKMVKDATSLDPKLITRLEGVIR
jgi:tripartite-type tricarboxylate transporter receptor subunit TctC